MIGVLFWLAVTGMVFVPVAAAAFGLLGIMLTVSGKPRGFGIPFRSRRRVRQLGEFGRHAARKSLADPVGRITGVSGVSFFWVGSLLWQTGCGNPGLHGGQSSVRPGLRCGIHVGSWWRRCPAAFLSPTADTVRVAGLSASRVSVRAASEALEAAVKEYWRQKLVATANPLRVQNAFSPINEELIARTEREARAGAGRLANVICYDADYPELMRRAAEKGADLMLVPAYDWEGAEYLHAENVVFRAVENGYSVVRQSSHGAHSKVQCRGSHTIAQVPLQARIPTIYSRVSEVFAWLCVAGTVLLATKSLSWRQSAL